MKIKSFLKFECTETAHDQSERVQFTYMIYHLTFLN